MVFAQLGLQLTAKPATSVMVHRAVSLELARQTTAPLVVFALVERVVYPALVLRMAVHPIPTVYPQRPAMAEFAQLGPQTAHQTVTVPQVKPVTLASAQLGLQTAHLIVIVL